MPLRSQQREAHHDVSGRELRAQQVPLPRQGLLEHAQYGRSSGTPVCNDSGDALGFGTEKRVRDNITDRRECRGLRKMHPLQEHGPP